MDGQETGDVSTVTVAVTSDKETLSESVAQANAGNNAAALPYLCQSASPVFTSHFYHRMPHPLSHLLKECPVLDGTDASLLCDILMSHFYLNFLSCFLKHALVYKVGS